MEAVLKSVLVIGGSRGIGAQCALILAQNGWSVTLTYNTRKHKADAVVSSLLQISDQKHSAIMLDVSDTRSVDALISCLQTTEHKLDAVIFSVAAGMETHKGVDYARKANTVAPLLTLRALFPRMNPGSMAVYLTSHEAHYYGRKPVYGNYAIIAETKRAGELLLVNAAQSFAEAGVGLHIVSADIVEDSPTAKLLEIKDRGVLQSRRDQVGQLPTCWDVALKACQPLLSVDPDLPFGSVTYVWEPIGYTNMEEKNDGQVQ